MSGGLELSSLEMRDLGELVSDFVLQYLQTLEEFDAAPENLSPAEVRQRVSEPLPLEGQEVENVWAHFQERVVSRSVRVGHPQFLAWIRSSPVGGAVFAEALAAALNQSVAVWEGAPAATEVERQVINWLIEISGYHPGGGGILTSGGSMANFSGLLAARSSLMPEVRQQGLRRGGPAAVYLTSQTHYSVHKGVEMMGLGRETIRSIPVDQHLRMDPDRLREQIDFDRRAGVRPMAVVATVGTTSTGACDDLVAISRVCREEEVWLHVDGAYGGSAALVSGKGHLLEGVDRADSYVLDPHKNLFMPFEAGCLLVRDPAHLRAAFGVITDYLPNTEDSGGGGGAGVHFRDYGPQLSRTFRALKIYLALKLYGVKAIADEIEREYGLAEAFAGMIRKARDFQLLAEPELGVVAFRYLPEERVGRETLNRIHVRMVDVLQQRGKVFLSRVNVRDRIGFRACFVSHRTRRRHLDRILEELRRVAVLVREG